MIDVKMKLMSGESFDVDGISVPSITLREIAKVGYSTYSMYLRMFTITLKDLGLENLSSEGVTTFDVLLLGDETVRDTFLSSLSFFLKRNDLFLYDESVVIDNGTINRENFPLIKHIIEMQNGMKKDDELNAEPVDEKTRQIMEKLKKGREKTQKLKEKDKDNKNDIDICDIISAVSTKSNSINIFNVWDLNVFQLYMEYQRLEVVSQYDISIQSLLHGADSKKIDIKHWSSKIGE